jgi:hypothetical protein
VKLIYKSFYFRMVAGRYFAGEQNVTVAVDDAELGACAANIYTDCQLL